MKNLYHGSVSKFDEICLIKGKGYKDFGKGFYATALRTHAEKLAIRNREILKKRYNILKTKNVNFYFEPVVAYRYNLIYDEAIGGLKIKVFSDANAEWLRFIIANRKCPISAHEYDIVIGPTADAQTTTIINEYMDELEESNFDDKICEKVIAELMPENVPKQYFFGTEKALITLKFDKVKREVIQ